jgi:hypothetical protein
MTQNKIEQKYKSVRRIERMQLNIFYKTNQFKFHKNKKVWQDLINICLNI